MQNYLPSDIKSVALRDAYYQVQKILSSCYDRDIKNAHCVDERRNIAENFKAQLRETINYYVGLCSHDET